VLQLSDHQKLTFRTAPLACRPQVPAPDRNVATAVIALLISNLRELPEDVTRQLLFESDPAKRVSI